MALAVEEDDRNHLGFPALRSSDSAPSIEQDIDEQWLLDQKLLFLGPLIGEGGHSNVYEGLYKKTRVAIKMIKPGNTPDQDVKRKEKFVREVLMLSRVQHENLVKFIGACKEPKMVLVTELLMGGSLKRFLRDMRPERLDLQLSIHFALDISRAMECLHANGIIHRDLKPDNLLLTQDQKKLKLADFGLAREETVTEMMTAETGTYRWMAPELYSTVTLRRGDKKHYNHKVDIYSFGMVLSELLTNRIPFEGMSNLQAAYAAAFKNQRPNVENIPKDFATLLESCWSENPASRPEFQDITYMLSNFLAALPSTKIVPPPTIEVGQSSFMTSDSPGTRHLMDRSRENEEIKPGRSSLGFLGCFNECFS